MTLRTAKLLALNEQAPLETSSDIVAPASTERKKEHPAPCVGKGNCIGLEHFNFLAILGKDNFGKVMLAETKTTKQLYAIRVLEEELAHDPGLAGEPLRAVGGGADHPHADLARGVAAEDRAVGDEGDAGAEAGGGDGGAHTGEATPDDHDVVVLFTGLHGGDGITCWRDIPTVWQSVPGKCYRQRTLDNEV